jgi:hypothetical protein
MEQRVAETKRNIASLVRRKEKKNNSQYSDLKILPKDRRCELCRDASEYCGRNIDEKKRDLSKGI